MRVLWPAPPSRRSPAVRPWPPPLQLRLLRVLQPLPLGRGQRARVAAARSAAAGQPHAPPLQVVSQKGVQRAQLVLQGVQGVGGQLAFEQGGATHGGHHLPGVGGWVGKGAGLWWGGRSAEVIQAGRRVGMGPGPDRPPSGAGADAGRGAGMGGQGGGRGAAAGGGAHLLVPHRLQHARGVEAQPLVRAAPLGLRHRHHRAHVKARYTGGAEKGGRSGDGRRAGRAAVQAWAPSLQSPLRLPWHPPRPSSAPAPKAGAAATAPSAVSRSCGSPHSRGLSSAALAWETTVAETCGRGQRCRAGLRGPLPDTVTTPRFLGSSGQGRSRHGWQQEPCLIHTATRRRCRSRQAVQHSRQRAALVSLGLCAACPPLPSQHHHTCGGPAVASRMHMAAASDAPYDLKNTSSLAASRCSSSCTGAGARGQSLLGHQAPSHAKESRRRWCRGAKETTHGGGTHGSMQVAQAAAAALPGGQEAPSPHLCQHIHRPHLLQLKHPRRSDHHKAWCSAKVLCISGVGWGGVCVEKKPQGGDARNQRQAQGSQVPRPIQVAGEGGGRGKGSGWPPSGPPQTCVVSSSRTAVSSPPSSSGAERGTPLWQGRAGQAARW